MNSKSATSKPSIVPVDIHLSPAEHPGLLAKLGRRLMLQQFSLIRHGELRVIEPNAEFRFGQLTERLNACVTIYVDHPQLYADAAFGGTVGGGEAYIRGLWRCDNLTGLIRLFVVNRDMMNGMDSRWSLISRPFLRLFHFLHRNSRQGSARNISAHYDLGNDLYRAMLDDTMTYSCGIFATPQSSLYEASIAKFEAVCRKLDLRANERLIEIGSGWGGLAIHAAQHYGCHVTTTTISREQHDYAKDKIAQLGLKDRITLLLEDYRDLKGRYDKAVSIEMVEAVGANFLDTYLRKCSSLLESHGAMLLQAITIQDQFYETARKSVDYIQRFIFPGSFIPSVAAISASLARMSDLKIYHLEDIGPHYARTLQLWRENFFANLASVRLQGYPESFVRLWEYYLCYCEGGFAERQLGNVQMLLTKPACRRLPLWSAAA